MALIPCPQCGKNISDKATKCPKCGYENIGLDSLDENKDANKSNIGFIFLILGLIFVLFSFFYSIREFNSASYEGYFYAETFLALLFVVVPIILFIISFFFFKKNVFNTLSIFLLVSFIISFLLVKESCYQSDIAPIVDFKKTYCNRNILSNLNNKTIAKDRWQFTITQNSIQIIGENEKFPLTIPINEIDADGVITSEKIYNINLGQIYFMIVPYVCNEVHSFWDLHVPIEKSFRVVKFCTNEDYWLDGYIKNKDGYGVCQVWQNIEI